MTKAAGIIFTDGKHILLLRKPDGMWCMPGGKLKVGETPIEGAKRESKEETGKVEGVRFAQYQDNDFMCFLFKINRLFPIKLSKEHTKSQWFKLDEVMNLKLHPQFKKHFPVTYLPEIKKKFPGKFSELIQYGLIV